MFLPSSTAPMPNPVRPQQSAGLWVEPRPAMTKSPVGTVFRLRSAALLCKILQPHKSPALSTTNQAPCFEFDIASLPAMSSEWELPDLRWLDAAGGKPACDNAEEPGTDDFLPSQYNQSSCSHLLSPTPGDDLGSFDWPNDVDIVKFNFCLVSSAPNRWSAPCRATAGGVPQWLRQQGRPHFRPRYSYSDGEGTTQENE